MFLCQTTYSYLTLQVFQIINRGVQIDGLENKKVDYSIDDPQCEVVEVKFFKIND